MPREYSLKKTKVFAALIMCAGLLILGGAGCSKAVPQAQPSTPAQMAPVVLEPTSTESNTSPSIASEFSTICYGQLRDIATLKSAVNAATADSSQVDDQFYLPVMDDFKNGWYARWVCVEPVREMAGIPNVAVVLEKDSHVTAQEVNSVDKVVGFTDKKDFKPESFNGQSFWGLAKIGYYGSFGTADDPFASGYVVSKPVAINGGPNQAGDLHRLTIAEDPLTGELAIVGYTRGGDQDYFKASISYSPEENKLTTRTCVFRAEPNASHSLTGKFLPPVCH